MIVIIGPQTTDEQKGDLEELAGLLHARCMSDDVDWTSVSRFLLVPGWEHCPVAVADVAAARCFGLPIEETAHIR